MVERVWAVRSYADNPRGGWSGTGTPAICVPLKPSARLQETPWGCATSPSWIQSRAWVAIRVGELDIRWTTRYAATYKHDGDGEPHIAAHTTHDITGAWAFRDGRLVLDVGVFNVGDQEPPRVYRQLNYDPLTHNPLGRVIQIGIRLWGL